MLDYHSTYGWRESQCHAWEVAARAQNPVTCEKEVAGPSSATPVVTDDTAALRRLLEYAGVIGSEEDPMKLFEMKSYVCGRITR